MTINTLKNLAGIWLSLFVITSATKNVDYSIDVAIQATKYFLTSLVFVLIVAGIEFSRRQHKDSN